MYRRFLPGLCLAVSSSTLSFQLLVVYPTQYKIHKELSEIKRLLHKKTTESLEN
jgi:hypothetical protein